MRGRHPDRGGGRRQTVIKECDDNELDYSVVETCTEDEHAATQDGTLQCMEDEQPVIDPDIGDGGDEDTGDDDSTDTDGESCLINTAIVSNPVGEDARLQVGCFDITILDRLRIVVIIVSGLVTGFVGFTLGQWIDGERQIRGPNRYTKQRQVDRRQRGNRTSSTAILGGLIGFAIGAAIGWFLGLWAFLDILLLLILKYISPF